MMPGDFDVTEHNEPTSNEDENEDAVFDVISAVAMVLIPAMTMVYWLSGMPS